MNAFDSILLSSPPVCAPIMAYVRRSALSARPPCRVGKYYSARRDDARLLTIARNVVAYPCRHSRAEDRQMPTPDNQQAHKPEYCELAHNYCLLGATNEVLGASSASPVAASRTGCQSPTTTWWRCSMPLARARAMPAGETGKRPAERAQRAEARLQQSGASDSSTISIMSTCAAAAAGLRALGGAETGGNRRNSLQNSARDTVRVLLSHLRGALQTLIGVSLGELEKPLEPFLARP